MRGSTVSEEVVAITIRKLFADITDEPKQAHAAPMRNRPEHRENEDEAGDIETDQKLAEREQRNGAELADGEGDGAERADWRCPHHDGDDAKKHLHRRLDQIVKRLARLPHPAQRKSAEHGDVKNLQDVAFAKRADEGIGDDVEQKLHRALPLCRLQVRRDDRGVDMRKIDVHAGARLEQN